MPGGDRTGPLGAGPMTGRGAGYCRGLNRPGFTSAGRGIGFGRGRRHRFFAWGVQGGYGRWAEDYYPGSYGAGATYIDEKTILKREADELKSALEAINARLDRLEQEGGEKS